MIKRLPCSDAKAIELVGMKLKDTAWDWYEQNIKGQLQSEHPPTWTDFRQAMMDEFLPQAERERSATQFKKLRQTPGVSVSDYAREFIRLSRYAQYMV